MAEFISGFEFEVRFDMIVASFAKLTNVGSKIEYDVYAEGGEEELHMFPKPKKQADTIIFEKGLHTNLTSDIFGTIKPGMQVSNVMIFVKHQGKTDRILYFDKGLVLSKSFSDFDAMGRSVLLERLEIAHSGLHEMPLL